MRRIVALLFAGLLAAPTLAAAQSQTEREVIQEILAGYEYSNKNLNTEPASYSKLGALEFWSSGGLLQEVTPDGRQVPFASLNIQPRHIRVITLVEGRAAVAMFYSEGSMEPQGFEAVPNYRTRVTQVFVKEDGRWRVRASHWSALRGGAGTTQTVQ